MDGLVLGAYALFSGVPDAELVDAYAPPHGPQAGLQVKRP